MIGYILLLIDSGMERDRVFKSESSTDLSLEREDYLYFKSFPNEIIFSQEFCEWLIECDSRGKIYEIFQDYMDLPQFEFYKTNKIDSGICEILFQWPNIDAKTIFVKLLNINKNVEEDTIDENENLNIDLSSFDEDSLNIFKEEDSKLKEFIEKQTNPKDYIIKKLTDGIRLSEDEIFFTIENNIIDMWEHNLHSHNFWKSVGDNGRTQLNKFFDCFNLENVDLNVPVKYIYYLDSVEDLCDAIDAGKLREELKDIKKEERKDRISFEDAKQLIKDKNLEDKIKLSPGHIGLEDMSFDYIIYNGEPYGTDGIHAGKIWVNGREFGDNKIKRSSLINLIELLGGYK